MGTSQSSGGPGPGVPMVPPWTPPAPPPEPQVPEPGAPDPSLPPPPGEQQPSPPIPTLPAVPLTAAPPVAPAARFRGTRRSLGDYARSGNRDDLKKALGHYVRSGYSGSTTASMTSRAERPARSAGSSGLPAVAGWPAAMFDSALPSDCAVAAVPPSLAEAVAEPE
jgi:hypothetical protein